MKLPELPPPGDCILFSGHREPFIYHGEEDLKAYGIACAKAALEEAARVCDEFQRTDTLRSWRLRTMSNYGKVIALKIRALEIEP